MLAVDLLCIGECGSAGKFHALMASVGDRILGLQAGQLAAVARWTESEISDGPVTIVAAGTRSSNIALTTAALEQKAIGELQLHGAMGSLKEVIDQNLHINDQPEVCCFGLLKAFDIKQLAALTAPRPVSFVAASDRAKAELSGLAAWYELLGNRFQPLK